MHNGKVAKAILLFLPPTFALWHSFSALPDATAAALQANTGLTYWIELKRAGQTSHVTQKENFISGDKIKFHVKPSIDGYIYVYEKSGSQGERALLFPIANSKDNNHVSPGVDVSIPEDDFMEFDAHPGTEKLSLILSKNPLDPKALAVQPPPEEIAVMKAQSGSKDLVPAKIKVVYTPPDATTMTGSAKADKKYAAAGIAYVPGLGASPNRNSHDILSREFSAGDVTVTRSDPNDVLNIDVDLQHSS